jgi:hypothetical protein
MTKKKPTPAPKKPAPEANTTLVEAIVTVKHLQDFVKGQGGLEKALSEVAKVSELVEMTGGFGQLKQALEIVGKEDAAAQA